MNTDEIIEIAIQGHASTRDAIRWAMQQEREACAKLVEADGLARGEYGYMLTKAATRIRARGAPIHAIDMSQEPVDETAKGKHEWIGLDHEQMRNTPIEFNRGALWAERYLKEKNT